MSWTDILQSITDDREAEKNADIDSKITVQTEFSNGLGRRCTRLLVSRNFWVSSNAGADKLFHESIIKFWESFIFCALFLCLIPVSISNFHQVISKLISILTVISNISPQEKNKKTITQQECGTPNENLETSGNFSNCAEANIAVARSKWTSPAEVNSIFAFDPLFSFIFSLPTAVVHCRYWQMHIPTLSYPTALDYHWSTLNIIHYYLYTIL